MQNANQLATSCKMLAASQELGFFCAGRPNPAYITSFWSIDPVTFSMKTSISIYSKTRILITPQKNKPFEIRFLKTLFDTELFIYSNQIARIVGTLLLFLFFIKKINVYNSNSITKNFSDHCNFCGISSSFFPCKLWLGSWVIESRVNHAGWRSITWQGEQKRRQDLLFVRR